MHKIDNAQWHFNMEKLVNWLFASWLTHLPLDKMAAFLQTIFSDAFFEWKVLYFDKKNSLKFVPKGPIHNKSAFVQVMAWRRSDNKPLPGTMLTQFTDIYMQH